MKYLLSVLFCVILVSCGGGDSIPPTCTGTSCACPSGAACDFTDSSCGEGSCSLDCSDRNECTGTCAESCSIDCSGGSTCTVTVGPSGSVSCGDGSICHVTCTDSCSVSCAADSECDLTCSGDSEPRAIPEGGGCG